MNFWFQVKWQLCICRPEYDSDGTNLITVSFLLLLWSPVLLVRKQFFYVVLHSLIRIRLILLQEHPFPYGFSVINYKSMMHWLLQWRASVKSSVVLYLHSRRTNSYFIWVLIYIFSSLSPFNIERMYKNNYYFQVRLWKSYMVLDLLQPDQYTLKSSPQKNSVISSLHKFINQGWGTKTEIHRFINRNSPVN